MNTARSRTLRAAGAAALLAAAPLLLGGCSSGSDQAAPVPAQTSQEPQPTGPPGSLVQVHDDLETASRLGSTPLVGANGSPLVVQDGDDGRTSQVLRPGGAATSLSPAGEGWAQAATVTADGTVVAIGNYGRSVVRLAPSGVVEEVPLSAAGWDESDSLDVLSSVTASSPDGSRLVAARQQVAFDPQDIRILSATGALEVTVVDTATGAVTSQVVPGVGRAGKPTSGATMELWESTVTPVAASVADDGAVGVVVDAVVTGAAHQDVLVRLGADLATTGSPVALPTRTTGGDHPSVRLLPDGSAVVLRWDRAPGGATTQKVLRVAASGEVSEVADLGPLAGADTWTSVQPDGAFAYVFHAAGTTVVDLATGTASAGPRPCPKGLVGAAPAFDPTGTWQVVMARCHDDDDDGYESSERVVVLGAT